MPLQDHDEIAYLVKYVTLWGAYNRDTTWYVTLQSANVQLGKKVHNHSLPYHYEALSKKL